MKYSHLKTASIALCLVGISACGSEKREELQSRKLTPNGGGIITSNSVGKNSSDTTDLNIAKNASFKFNFPAIQKQSCIDAGGKAEWKITSANITGVTLENSALCEVTVHTSAAFAAKITLEGKFSSSLDSYTYTADMTPASCPSGSAETTPNADGSIQCVQAATGKICTDDLALAAFKYNETDGAHLLFGGSNPSFSVDHNCRGNSFTKLDIKLVGFNESQEYVTKGHIKIQGRSATVDYDFCLDPAQPSKIFFSPTAPTVMPNFADLTIFGSLYRIAYFKVDSNADAGYANITMNSTSVRQGETSCGTSFSSDAAYLK